MKSFNPLLIVLATVLIIMNITAVAALSIEESRWVRFMSAVVFVGVYFFHYSRKTLLLMGALISLLIADAFALTYHLDYSKSGFFTFHGIAYLFLFLHISRGTRRTDLSRFQKNFILIASILSFALLLVFGINFQSDMAGYKNFVFFYFHGFSAIICLISALSFYDNKMNSFAMFYLMATMGFIFSDLTAFPAQYLKAENFYYFSRIFYVTGLASLVQFAYLSTQSRAIKTVVPVIPEVVKEEVENFYHNH